MSIIPSRDCIFYWKQSVYIMILKPPLKEKTYSRENPCVASILTRLAFTPAFYSGLHFSSTSDSVEVCRKTTALNQDGGKRKGI